MPQNSFVARFVADFVANIYYTNYKVPLLQTLIWFLELISIYVRLKT